MKKIPAKIRHWARCCLTDRRAATAMTAAPADARSGGEAWRRLAPVTVTTARACSLSPYYGCGYYTASSTACGYPGYYGYYGGPSVAFGIGGWGGGYRGGHGGGFHGGGHHH